MIINECVKARSAITGLKALDNKLIVFSTQLHGIKFFSLEESKVTLNFTNEYLNSKTTAISFSNNSQHVAIANDRFIYIFHMPSRELVQKISTNKEEIEILSFDLSSVYVIAGTKSGRVLQYRYNESSLLSRLCSFPTTTTKTKNNFVSAFAFYKNKIACSGFGGSIVVIDLHSLSNKDILTLDTTRINALCFVDKDTIISGNIDGIINILSLENKQFHKQISTPFKNIKQIILMPNPEFILVSGDSNTLAIINITTYEISKEKYIELEDSVQKIALLDEETIVIALDNGKIIDVTLPSISKLQSLIELNALDEAFNLLEDDPMLNDSKEHKILENKFDKIYLETVEALMAQNKKLALQLINKFKNIPSLKEKITLLFEAFEHYPRFQLHYSEQKLSLAYAMAHKFPALQHTWQFIRMEDAWKTAFKSAQKQVLLGNIENAKLYLNAYSPVLAKKELIQLILKNNSEFISFLKAIDKQKFSIVEQLVSKNPLFEEIPTYITLNKEIDYNLKKAKWHVEKGNLKSANRYLEKIKDVPKAKEELKKLKKRCEKIIAINELYNQGDFNACYKMIDTHLYLASTEFGLLLEKHWSKTIHKCEEFALKGNIKDIKATLGDLLYLETRRDKIGDMLRVSFHTRIKMLMAKKAFKQAETIVYSYMDIFGFDQEINAIMKTFESMSSSKLAINHIHNHQPSRDAWINSTIIMGSHS